MEKLRSALSAQDFPKCLQLIKEAVLGLNDHDSRNFQIALTSPRKDDSHTQSLLINSGINAVCTAVMNNLVQLVPLLHSHGADLNGQHTDGNRPVHFAVLANSSQMLAMLLERGVDVNSRGKNDATALYIAVLNQKPAFNKLTTILLEAGAQTNITDVKGMQVVHIATLGGDTVTVSQLVKFGADINAQVGSMTSLYIACRNGNNVMAEHLLKHGASTEIPGEEELS